MTKKQEEYKAFYEARKNEKIEYYDLINQEHELNKKRWGMETQEQKAERTFKNVFITHYELMTNFVFTRKSAGWAFQETYLQFCEEHKKLKKDFMEIAIAYLGENTNALWVPKEIYQKLLPERELSKVVQGGFQRIGELLKNN